MSDKKEIVFENKEALELYMFSYFTRMFPAIIKVMARWAKEENAKEAAAKETKRRNPEDEARLERAARQRDMEHRG